MAHLKKKYVAVGAPLWMAQFTSVMIILIVLIMILCTMAPKQEGPAKYAGDGFGFVRKTNALGIVISGTGSFKFGKYGRSRSYAPNPKGEKTEGVTSPAPHKNLTDGKGGDGNTDVKTKDKTPADYLVLRIPIRFKKDNDKYSKESEEALKKIALFASITDYELHVKSFSTENNDEAKDSSLALSRAIKIMKFIFESADIPKERISCFGYSSAKMLAGATEEDKAEMQGSYLWCFISEKKK